MRNSLSIALAGCLTAAFCVPARSAPTTAPSNADISALVDQLGDDNFAIRQTAGDKLAERGSAAKSALEQAAAGGSPEVRMRAADLLHRLETLPFPGAAPEGGPLEVHVDQAAGVVDVTDQGRNIRIQKSADGIDMTVHGFIDGKPVTTHYKATDADDLKRQSPEAYNQFQQWEANGNGQVELMQSNGRLIIVGGGTLVINDQPPPAQGDDFARLSSDLITQMERKRFTDAQEAKIKDDVDAARKAKEDADAEGPIDGPAHQAYLKASDDLRKQIAGAGLSDPGAVLPPPAGSRLGVSVQEGDGFPGGVAISSVAKDSRGEKMGLMMGDVVHAANGKPIANVTDLRIAVTTEKNLTLSVTRDGQELTLQEPGAGKN